MHTRSVSLALALGTLGGTALVLSEVFFAPGKYILMPYAAFAIAIAVVLRGNRVATFRERFWIGFAAFVIASLALYVAIDLIVASSLPVGGHLWRIAAIAGVGALLNLALARVSDHGAAAAA